MTFLRMLSRLLPKALFVFVLGTFFYLFFYWDGDKKWISHPAKRWISQNYSADLPGCMAIIRGDTVYTEDSLAALLSSRVKTSVFTEPFYLNATKNCSAYIEKRGFITQTLSEEERHFPLAYSMVIHEKIEMFERLLRAIYAPQNVYCVHVDQKTSTEFKAAVESIASCFENVFVASKLESVVYASWSRVQADLNCMADLLASPVRWRYMLNTCGTDFPIKTNREMVQVLKTMQGRNSMETETTNDYKKTRWQYHYTVTDTISKTSQKKSPPPIKTPMFSGNAYFVASRAFVEHVMKDPEVHTLIEWEKDTYSPDEHLWATLQRMPAVPGSAPPNNKFDESDMLAMARAVKWSYLTGDVKNGAPYPPCTGTYRRAVCVYGAGDLTWLLEQKHLMANKFDPEVDDIAIRCLEAVLHYKALGHDPLNTQL